MHDWWAVIGLGIIEGITEFLPVSSTGHLLIAEHWLPAQSELFNVVIQCGAVLAVLVIFKERVKQMLFHWPERGNRDFLSKLTVAFVITGLGGVLLKLAQFKLPEEAAPVAWATLIGGILFLVVERWLRGRPLSASISWAVAVAAGLAQLLAAVFPGTSRAGATILIMLALGLNRVAATEFSFLLGIPTLLAAGALEIFSALRHPTAAHEPWGLILVASAVAAVTAFGAVKWLLGFVQSHTFVGFGWYRIGLGLLILILAR